MDKVHCRTCTHLRKYDKTQGYNQSGCGWCNKLGALRHAQVARNCKNYQIENYFKKDAPQQVCYNCENLQAGFKPPHGDRFNDEFRCRKYPFVFWYKDNTEGIHSITCNSYMERCASVQG